MLPPKYRVSDIVKTKRASVFQRRPDCKVPKVFSTDPFDEDHFDLQSELNLEDIGSSLTRIRESKYGLYCLILPKRTLVYRGTNSKQKPGRPLFFAFSSFFSAKYGKVNVFETKVDLVLVEAHYPIELDEGFSENGRILMELLEKDTTFSPEKKDLIRRAIKEHLLSKSPVSKDTISMDSALAQFVCSLGLEGWIRLGEGGYTDEIALCEADKYVEWIAEEK